jgi:hypothetical protein
MCDGISLAQPSSMRIAAFAALPLAGAIALAACSRDEGNLPVGTEEASPLQQERFLRRLHVDLTGAPPEDAVLAAALERLRSEGNHATVRGAIAHELTASQAFAENWIAELENRAFEGDTVKSRYDFFCIVLRTVECVDCQGEDPCDCSCPEIVPIHEERTELEKAVGDFAGGATTGSIERRYAATEGFRFPLGPDAVSELLFSAFLDRPVEDDERRNSSAMVLGSFIPGSPAGLLFHQHGADYDDLVGIVFGSEPYRDAAVDRVFVRYLGRRATPVERNHFAAGLDPADPDVRGVIEAVLASQEYFDQ